MCYLPLLFYVDQRLNLTKDNPDDDDAVRGQLIGVYFSLLYSAFHLIYCFINLHFLLPPCVVSLTSRDPTSLLVANPSSLPNSEELPEGYVRLSVCLLCVVMTVLVC